MRAGAQEDLNALDGAHFRIRLTPRSPSPEIPISNPLRAMAFQRLLPALWATLSLAALVYPVPTVHAGFFGTLCS